MASEPTERERPTSEGGRGSTGGKRLMTLLIGVAAVAAVAAVGVFAYKEGMRRGAESVAPVITAGPAPDKVKPENPGGMEVPNQDKQIYDRLSPETAPKPVERLLPPPEQPMSPPSAPSQTASAPGGNAASGATAPAAAPAGSPETHGSMQPPPMEKPVPPAPAPPPPPKEEAAKPAAPAPPAAPPEIAPASGGYRVQLAAVRTEEQASRVIAHARRATGDVLGGLAFSTVRADLGSRGIYYRVQAGPLADAAAAKALCAQLKARKQGCLVVAP